MRTSTANQQFGSRFSDKCILRHCGLLGRSMAAAILLGCAALIAGCSQSDCIPTTLASTSKLVAISIGPPDGRLAAGTTQQYVITGIYANGTRVDLSSQVSLTSSAANVASVGSAAKTAALVTAVTPGTTTITATLDGVSGSTHLTVSPATLVSIGVTSATADLPLGLNEPYVAIGVYSDHTTQDLTNAVTWTSATSGVATISNASGSNGLAEAATTGATTINASLNGVSGSKGLTVTPAVLESIEVAIASTSAGVGNGLAAGLTEQFVATGIYSDGTKHDLTSQVTWTSATGKVGSITASGLASGLTAGSTVLTAALGNVSGTQTLNVTPAKLVSIGVTPANPNLPAGLHTEFTATGIYSDGTTKDLTSLVLWSSSNPPAAAVSNASGYTGLATALVTGTTTVTAALAGVSGSSGLNVTPATLLSIDVSPANPGIANGTTQNLTATGIYSDGTRSDLTSTVAWTSSNTSVAPISNSPGSNGQATGTAPGTTTITAATGGVSASTGLTVTPATLVSIAVTPANPSIANGTNEPFVATGTYSDHTTQNLTTAVTWSSTSATVASISNAQGSNGMATAAGVGSTTITAALGSVSGSTPLTVTAATLKSITVTPAAATIPDGTTEQYVATGVYSNNSTQDLTSSVVWTSSTPATASISNAAGSAGLASGAGVGSTTIAAQLGSISGSTSLAVTAATLVSIAVTPANPTIANGTTEQFVATGTYSDHSTQNLTTSVAWTSGTPTVATIGNAPGSDGLASAASQGSTTITATSGSISGSATLNVSAATLVSIAVTPTNPSIAAGTAKQFTAVGTYSDHSTQDLTSAVTWSSATPVVASISNAAGSQGLASSTTQGSSIISATLGGIVGSTTLNVSAATLVAIAVTPVNPSIAAGTAKQFTAIGTYSDHSTQDLTSAVTWSSATPAVASISNAAGSQGLASSTTQGSSVISAALGGTVGSTNLTVTSATLVSIAVTPANPSIAAGTTEQLTATGTYSDHSMQVLTSSVTWSSATPAVASISNASGSQGLASSTTQGSSVISATLGSISGSTTLTVTPATLVSIAVTPASLNIVNGNTQQFTATGTYSDNSTQNLTTAVTWSSSSTATASISNASGSNGLASATALGTTTIQAVLGSISGSTTATVVTSGYAYVSNRDDNTISEYTVDSHGTLTPLGTIATGNGPFHLTVDPANRYVYVTNAGNSAQTTTGNTITEYAIGANGLLTNIGSIATGGTPLFALVDSSSHYVYVANGADSTISQYAIGAGGVLSLLATVSSNGAGPFTLALDPTGQYLYAADVGGNLAEFAVGSGGTLTAIGTVAAGNGPAWDVVTPSGLYAYVSDANSSTLTEFTAGSGGALTMVGTVTLPASPRTLTVDSTSTYVYAAVPTSNSIEEYSIGAGGALTSIGSIATGASPFETAYDPSQHYYYVVNSTSGAATGNTVWQYGVGANGTLTFLNSVATGTTPTSIVVIQ